MAKPMSMESKQDRRISEFKKDLNNLIAYVKCPKPDSEIICSCLRALANDAVAIGYHSEKMPEGTDPNTQEYCKEMSYMLGKMQLHVLERPDNAEPNQLAVALQKIADTPGF